MLFLGHMVVFLFPASVLAWNSDPVRLIAHEGVSFTFAVAVVVGLIGPDSQAFDGSQVESRHDAYGLFCRICAAHTGIARLLDRVGLPLGIILVRR